MCARAAKLVGSRARSAGEADHRRLSHRRPVHQRDDRLSRRASGGCGSAGDVDRCKRLLDAGGGLLHAGHARAGARCRFATTRWLAEQNVAFPPGTAMLRWINLRARSTRACRCSRTSATAVRCRCTGTTTSSSVLCTARAAVALLHRRQRARAVLRAEELSRRWRAIGASS